MNEAELLEWIRQRVGRGRPVTLPANRAQRPADQVSPRLADLIGQPVVQDTLARLLGVMPRFVEVDPAEHRGVSDATYGWVGRGAPNRVQINKNYAQRASDAELLRVIAHEMTHSSDLMKRLNPALHAGVDSTTRRRSQWPPSAVRQDEWKAEATAHALRLARMKGAGALTDADIEEANKHTGGSAVVMENLLRLLQGGR
jgi:hypothetical protein